ncbi:DMT family transporter [Bdellovibrionota bacterium FG-2]
MIEKVLGPILIGLAAFMWATDALMRVPVLRTLDPTFIVFIEHLIGVGVLMPWVLFKYRKGLFGLSKKEWLGALVIGAGGSGLATVLFTASFGYVNPTIAILLQKLQPLFVLLLAVVFLRERPGWRVVGWGILALISAVVLSFPHFDLGFLDQRIDIHSKGVLYAVGAAFLWALATIIGKAFLMKNAPDFVTFWRFSFGLVAVGVLLFLGGAGLAQEPWGKLMNESTRNSLLYMALVPGLLSMLFYYAGLSRASASVASLVELTFPLFAVVLNYFFLGLSLTGTQLGAGAVLVFAVSRISVSKG